MKRCGFKVDLCRLCLVAVLAVMVSSGCFRLFGLVPGAGDAGQDSAPDSASDDADQGTDRPDSESVDGGDSDADGDGPQHWVFRDELQEHFDSGSYDKTTWNGTGVALEPAETTGSFTSRIFDTQYPAARWTTLSWTPRAPCDKALPGSGDESSTYAEDGIDTTGLVGLWHLAGASADLYPIEERPESTEPGSESRYAA